MVLIGGVGIFGGPFLANLRLRYMAKLKANFKCDEFTLYDDGHIKELDFAPVGVAGRRRSSASRLSFKSRSPPPPAAAAAAAAVDDVDPSRRVRKQIAQIQYTSHKISYTGPRQILISIPNPRAVEGVEDPQYFVNKLPEYDKQSKQHSLKFYGRATEASVKNFCLIRDGPRFQVRWLLATWKVRWASAACMTHPCRTHPFDGNWLGGETAGYDIDAVRGLTTAFCSPCWARHAGLCILCRKHGRYYCLASATTTRSASTFGGP